MGSVETRSRWQKKKKSLEKEAKTLKSNKTDHFFRRIRRRPINKSNAAYEAPQNFTEI